ncbi:P-LOOP CONTAINING NUCLEOSIDE TRIPHOSPHATE HYDROLASES SUPERFAMILY PROTEIN [Salix viminalis]|uniref:p-LOOP CONTAINING NUCLEOSIDE TRIPHOSPHATE HYDROLASES SUPERFAMILY PROTEIN n=1 Tax=Salix viminalis TaxID=40686 RepID=A0A9Q0TN34_SALVM|nr:P-LOOP CONTAINING NUCLEOSIDE TRIPHOSPHATE HYDROLASES SUPERFAMILY PROTEIN [Salix viminalis]
MSKGKELMMSTSPNDSNHNTGVEDDDEEDGFDYSGNNKRFSSFPSFSSRNASSKYDFVKVRVWLGDNADHYYVLSRFLLSRMLTVTKIPNHVAIKIALELKKLLIDNSLLDVSQSDLEANLFKLMERRGYGEDYINRYKMMTRFHHQRVPLVILVCGTACVGKSTIATQLAQRLNLPNVLQTDMVYELLRTSTDAPLASTPVWAREFSSSEELITEFCRECRIVRKGLAGDLKKAMKDGKPIIIEGIHLDPSIYLMDEENKLPTKMPEKSETDPVSVTPDDDPARQNPTSVSRNHTENINCTPGHLVSEEGKSVNLVNKVVDSQGSRDKAGSIVDNEGETVKGLEGDRKTSVSLKSGPEPIIIPIVLKMAEFDHKASLEEWISTRSFSDNRPVEEKDRLITNLKIIQDYLCSFKSQGLTVANISATTFPQTLDWLHGYLLQSIEHGISSVSSENVRQQAQN